MDKNTARTIIASREVINAAGKYRVKVTNVTDYHKELPGGSKPQVAIINFNAMTGYHVEAAKTLYGQGDYQEACNQNLTTSVRKDDFLPVKGEIVDIVVGELTTKNNVTGLFVISMTPVGIQKTNKLDMDSWDSETEPRVALETEEQTTAGVKDPAKAFK